MRGLRCGLLDESFGCGGPTLASELGQSQLSDVLQRTRVQWELFDYSNRPRTVSNANYPYVTAMFQCLRFRNTLRSANLPCYGLSVDPVALCLRLLDGKGRGMRVLRGAKTGRCQVPHRVSRPALLRHSEYVPIHARARDDRALRASGRTAEAAGRSGQ